MRKFGIFVSSALFVAGLGWSPTAAQFSVRDQNGIVAATTDGSSETATLPQGTQGTASVTRGTPISGSDYAQATATTEFQPDMIRIILTGDVHHWGDEGGAKARVVVQFGVERDTGYMIETQMVAATGAGWLGDRALIVLSNADGVILTRTPGGGYDACNYMHPNAQTLCTNRTLTPDVYNIELKASAFAPTTCGSCKGYAVDAGCELRIVAVP
jgi:hypothetical protein